MHPLIRTTANGTMHADVNARRRDYAHLGPDRVRVTKIFPTLQGEGPLAGQFAVFVRLAGCNLGKKASCPFCDTFFDLKTGTDMHVIDVLDAAEDVRRDRQKLVVLTGGEPLLQPGAPLLINTFVDAGWRVQVETNGYFWPDDVSVLSWEADKFMIVVSPKVNARGIYPDLNKRLRERAACLKILVEDEPGSPYHYVPQYAHAFAETGRPVYLSPINVYRRPSRPGEVASVWDLSDDRLVDHERSARNTRRAATLAMEWGYRLSLQTHLFAALE